VPDRDLPAFDCYRALGVPVSATTADIEVAFRAAAKREHPDLHEDAVAATARMQRLNIARDWLTDPQRRASYDAARGLRPPPEGAAHHPGAVRDQRWMAPPDAEPSGSMTGPLVASLALMVALTMLLVGTGTVLTAAILVVALAALVVGIALTILGATR
jgi:hypothetical protein